MNTDTIAAIATPVGQGGIGIIRISGQKSLQIIQEIFTPGIKRHHCGSFQFRPHSLNHGFINDPVNGETIDEVLVAVMLAPHSYTRENVVEIQSHGGYAVLEAILDLVLRYGARLAEAGEFTKRAFLNGRIDLSQAEAVADLINAKSRQSLKLAVAHLKGAMKDKVNGFIEFLNRHLALIQAGIEFPEDVDDCLDAEGFVRDLETHVLGPTQQMIDNYQQGKIYRHGIELNIIGKPNVGKSSLLNVLTNLEKAIVTDIPGTTRDPIEANLSIRGIPITLSDTAGLHTTEDPIEKLGIQKTHESIDRADLVLMVIDSSADPAKEDFNIQNLINSKNYITVFNKIDLLENRTAFKEKYRHFSKNVAFISARTGQAIEDLKDLIAKICLKSKSAVMLDNMSPTLRQKYSLEKALSALHNIKRCFDEGLGEEIAVFEIEDAVQHYNQVTGSIVDYDILDDIFSRFCIGK
ncbi:MAG: tRNA uridine-5-carboxymethylaminomethyl(34) synthesis GTPase MnmE [Desulfobacteraceae bacterium]|nr:tRNA uridine-5-carboxymethylaminomethyl(34) synthesis GTPase MnmE [Desulfobacteraceae bacterium]